MDNNIKNSEYDLEMIFYPYESNNSLFGYNMDEVVIDEFFNWCENKGLAANEEIFEIWVQCSEMDVDEEEKYLFDKGLL